MAVCAERERRVRRGAGLGMAAGVGPVAASGTDDSRDPSGDGDRGWQRETWPAEVGVSLVFSGAAFPVAMAAGATIPTAATIATVFALNFVLATLGVRRVILEIRGGGDPAAVASTRRAVLALACVVPMTIVLACLKGMLPWTDVLKSENVPLEEISVPFANVRSALR